MTKKPFKLEKLDNDEDILNNEYILNGTLVDSNGETIFLNNAIIFLDEDDYFYLKNNQEYICSFEEILSIFKSVAIRKEPKIPFPQADVFEVFVEICEKLYQHKSLTKIQIMDIFNLNPRQYSFYMSAGEYLSLINKKTSSNERSLSQIGLGVFSLSIKQRNLAIVKLILQHKPFYEVFRLYLDDKIIPDTDEIFEVLKRNEIYNVNSDVTLRRRATSVRSWIKWIIALYD